MRLLKFLLLEKVEPNDYSEDGIHQGDKIFNDSFTLYFTWKGEEFTFFATFQDGDWDISFEDEGGSTLPSGKYGAATHEFWSIILLCLVKFLHWAKPKSFSLYGHTDKQDKLYKGQRMQQILKQFTGYSFKESFRKKTIVGERTCYKFTK